MSESTEETKSHIKRVAELLGEMGYELARRAEMHDKSKLQSPEVEVFEEFTPRLKGCTYGSDEYKGFLKEMKPALDHHYGGNSHHPEHHAKGIAGMTLIDLVEMFFDWRAAGERHADGSMDKSIKDNSERFEMDPQLIELFKNTHNATKDW